MSRRVAVAARQRLVRDGLTCLLGSDPSIEVVGAAATSLQLAAICRLADARVAVVHLEEGAHQTIVTARARVPGVRIVGITDGARPDLEHLVDSVVGQRDGAAGLRRAVCSDDSATSRSSKPPRTLLTPREREVAERLVEGSTTAIVAESLGISAHTVENHKRRIYAKVGVQSQCHLAAVLAREGLVDTA